MKRWLKYSFVLLVVLVLSLENQVLFADQPGASNDPSFQIISPDSGQQSSQGVEVSKSQLISLDFTNANLTDVLKAIAYSYNINIVLTQDLKGRISAKLKNFSLDDALTAILSSNNYGFMRKKGIIYIQPTWTLDKLTETLPLSFITTKQALTLLKGALGQFSGVIQENDDANTLVVTAVPTDMAMIKRYLKNIDVAPIQVMIDAELVSLSKNDSSDIGSTINVTYSGGHVALATLLSGAGAAVTSSNINTTSASSNGSTGTTPTTTPTNTTLATTQVPGGTDGSIFAFSGNYKNFSPTIAINDLITQNKAHVIASPSIATLNGHEATILIGEQYPYQTSSTTVNGNGSASVVSQTQTQYIDIGTKLKVTPIVSPDGWITLKVEPEVSSLNGTGAAGNPIITTSSADTEVRVRNNETIVIGGLKSRDDNFNDNGSPVLKSIPILGWFFDHKTSTANSGTLTVLITPHIVSMAPVSQNGNFSSNPPISRGNDSSLIEGLLDNAQELEGEKTKDSANNLYISEQQIKIYREILEQFPQSGKTDFCLYRIAFIYGKDFGNCVAAQEALTEMKDFYPHSPYVKVTDLFVNACEAVGSQGDKK